MRLVYLGDRPCPHCKQYVGFYESDDGKIIAADGPETYAVACVGDHHERVVAHFVHTCSEATTKTETKHPEGSDGP